MSENDALPVLLGQHPVRDLQDIEKGQLCKQERQPSEDDIAVVTTHSKYCEKVVLNFGLVFALAQGASTPAIAWFIAEAVDALQARDPDNVMKRMGPILIKIGAIALIQFLLGFLWQSCLAWAAAKQSKRWHLSFVGVLLSLDVSWYDEHEPAGVAAKLEADINNVHFFMSKTLGFLIASFAQFMGGLVFAMITGWQLALVVCATIPILLFFGHLLGKEIAQQTIDQQRDFAQAATVAEESIMAIRTVAAFGGEGKATARFEKELLSAKLGGIRTGAKIGFAAGGLNLFYSCFLGLPLLFGGHYLLSHNDVNKTGMVTVIFAMCLAVSGLISFSGFLPILAKAVTSAKAMKQMMAAERVIEPPLHTMGELPDQLQTIDTIEFKSVSFRYPTRPEKWVLQNFSFRVEKGQKIALVGESGCGKSTTIQLLERFYDPRGGEVLVNGIQLCKVPVKAWRQLIGYVGQEPVLFATSAMKNIKAGDDSISDEQVMEAAKGAQIYETLMGLPDKFETFVGAGGGLLSGGQRQRLAIARALAKSPQLLLLDEATSALDNESERMVQETLDSLLGQNSQSITTVSIAHRLTTIRSSDIIYVLKDGSCCEQGSHEALMEIRGEYYNMAKLQADENEENSNEAMIQNAQSEAIEGKAVMLNSCTQSRTPRSLQETANEEGGAPARIWRRLFRFTTGHWWVWPAAFVIVSTGALAMPLEAVYFNIALNALSIVDHEVMLSELDAAIEGLMLVGLGFGVVGFCQNWLFIYMQECLCMILRTKAFQSLIHMEMAFFDAPENQTSSILVSLERHMCRVGQMLGTQLGLSTIGVLTCLVSVSISFAGSWVVALILLGLLPICGILMMLVARFASGVDPQVEETHATAGKFTAEAATAIRTVRALGAEEHTLLTLSDSLDYVCRSKAAKSWKMGVSVGLNLMLPQVINLVSFWIGGISVQFWSFDSQQVLMTVFCMLFGTISVGLVAQHIPDSASGYHAAMQVFRLIDQVSEIDAAKSEGCKTLGDGSIEFRNVHFWYPHRPEVRVLRKLSLTILKGQSVALCGVSGSGKSTVVQLLQRFYDPQAGVIRVGGQDLKDLDIAFWRQQLGFVGQEPMLFDMSLEENVKYGYPEATEEEVREAARAANMDYALSGAVQWTDRIGLRGEKLSGGQKQRCAIARALLRKPQFMLLDEATSALDAVSESVVLQAMKTERVGKTTITVAHRLSTIQNADKIFVLCHGRLLESGTYQELINMDGSFAKLAARSL